MFDSITTWLFDTNWIIGALSLVLVVGLYQAFKTKRTEFGLIVLAAALQIASLYVTLPALAILAPLALAAVLPKQNRELRLPTVRPLPLLAVIIILAAATRLKGIESLTISSANDFGWETSSSYMASSTWHSAVMSGIKHHSISQGFLWHVMYFVMHKVTDDPIIGGRLFFAMASIANIGLVFLVSRLLYGNWVAIGASAIFAFTPLEPAWARSNYGMVLATSLSLLVTYSTFRALRVSPIIFSALTMLSYPAATTMGIFPLVAGCIARSRRAIFVGLAGLSLWILVPSLIVSVTELSPTWISPMRLHSSDRSIVDVANRAPQWGESLTTSLYKNVRSLATKVGAFSDGDEYFVLSALKPKYLLGRITLIFLPVGLYLIRGSRNGLALVCWLALSLVTAVTSVDVIPRRFSTFIAPISIISGYGAAVAVAALWRPVAIALATIVVCGVMSFTTYFRDLRAPYTFSTSVVSVVEKELHNNTLVLLDNIPAPCVSWIFHRLGSYAQQGSYISNRTGSPDTPLELTNDMAKEMPWYRDTSIKDTFSPGPVSRIVVFAANAEHPPHAAPGLAVTEHSTITIEWFTLHKFVIERAH